MAALSRRWLAIVTIVMLFSLPHERAAEVLAGGVVVGMGAQVYLLAFDTAEVGIPGYRVVAWTDRPLKAVSGNTSPRWRRRP